MKIAFRNIVFPALAVIMFALLVFGKLFLSESEKIITGAPSMLLPPMDSLASVEKLNKSDAYESALKEQEQTTNDHPKNASLKFNQVIVGRKESGEAKPLANNTENSNPVSGILSSEKKASYPKPKSSAGNRGQLDFLNTENETQEEPNGKPTFNAFIRQNSKHNDEKGDVAGNRLIPLLIDGDQKIFAGDAVRLRLAESVKIRGENISRNTILTGVANFSNDRLHISINRIKTGDEFLNVNFAVYDSDNLKGIKMAGGKNTEMIRGAGEEVVDEAISQATSGLLSRLTRSAFNNSGKQLSAQLAEGYKVFMVAEGNFSN